MTTAAVRSSSFTVTVVKHGWVSSQPFRPIALLLKPSGLLKVLPHYVLN